MFTILVVSNLGLATGFLPRCKNQIHGLPRTTFTMFTENCINPKQHFYKHIYTGSVYI